DFSGRPLEDVRTDIQIVDVAEWLRRENYRYDVIALDVDNGPEGLTKKSNHWLYTAQGIHAVRKALNPKGILAYWSAGADPDFRRKFGHCGFKVEEVKAFAHGRKGARHTIWLGMVDR
ncbi:MAG TPA: hypothetical protein ENJ30_01300, partial [Desulfobulbaceae bacterium]|nr:hypothetical protein [Desulfobulbaceae bacterium]